MIIIISNHLIQKLKQRRDFKNNFTLLSNMIHMNKSLQLSCMLVIYGTLLFTGLWMGVSEPNTLFLQYSSVEEAIETRNIVYNLQWPPNGGRLLVAEFVDTRKVKMRVDAPLQSPAAPVTPSAAAPAPSTLQPQPGLYYRKQLPLSQQQSIPPHARERVNHPPPFLPPEKHI